MPHAQYFNEKMSRLFREKRIEFGLNKIQLAAIIGCLRATAANIEDPNIEQTFELTMRLIIYYNIDLKDVANLYYENSNYNRKS